ncbi:flagellar brake protein [uncultured Aquabacterium sp.]|jgi:c-di-GMP-binding flagellar brake protein YcgR|uniref:flagellar brake protein n=1 Tax=uncultured Aquabacterium sp. TaxID=158753 RepID=UPI0026162CC5|nr:flagellar brake protein [uncultured Aquabacterium sp.]
MDTRTPSTPASRGRVADLDDYRITSAVEIAALLRQMHDEHALVTLSAPGGASYTTVLLTIDPQRHTVTLSAEEGDARIQALLDSNEVSAVAYLDSIKVEFDMDGLVLVHGTQGSTLHASLPTVAYRFQRRAAFRVQPLASSTPLARLVHPARPDAPLVLRVLDVSLHGVALLLPPDAPMVAAGSRIQAVDLELDEETQLSCDLIVHHVTALGTQAPAHRLGCELAGIDPRDRTLALYVNQTQKRRLATLGSIKG